MHDAAPTCGPEIDFAVDPLNCGACEHSCLGGDCVDARCQPITLASQQGSLRQLLLDDTYIYYVGPGALKRLAKSGGSPELIASYSGTGFRMTMSGSYLYWVTRDTGLVARATKIPGSITETIATGQGDAGGIATDGTTVWWNNYPTGGQIFRKDLEATGGGTPILPATDDLTGMRLVGGALYYLRDGAGLFRIPPGGSAPPVTIAPSVGSWEMAIDDNTAFLVNATKDAVLRVNLSTGEVGNVAAANNPWGIVVDATHVYYANETGDTIARAPRSGGTAEILATPTKPVGIAVDDKAVYWTTLSGEVSRVAK